jgi:hypothetical protein
METKYKNWAPRFGISYSPDSKLVVRTGFGIFYNQDIGNAVFDMSRNIAGRVTLTSNIGTPSLFYNNSVPGGAGATAFVPPPFAYVNALDHATSYTMQYLVNVQRQIAGNWVIEGGYLGTLSHHLFGFQNANQTIPWGYLGTVATPVTAREPYANYGVIQLVADGANANYNGLSLKATRRFSQGISIISSYTWSKSIDDTSGIRVQGFDTLYPQNSDCIQCERGLSSFDVRHRSVTSVLYDLPIGKGKRLNVNNPFLNGIVGGWQGGGILTLQSGVPGVVTIGGTDNASTGNSGYDRPNSTGISPYLSNPTPSRWLNPAAYTEAAPGFFGNVGRNTIESPGIFNIDGEVHKQFKMPYNENHVLQFRIEAFNAMNHPNWGMPSLNVLNGAAFPGQPGTNSHQNFGVVGSTSTSMRQVQLGLKYSF